MCVCVIWARVRTLQQEQGVTSQFPVTWLGPGGFHQGLFARWGRRGSEGCFSTQSSGPELGSASAWWGRLCCQLSLTAATQAGKEGPGLRLALGGV